MLCVLLLPVVCCFTLCLSLSLSLFSTVLHALVAVLLASSQYPEGPVTGHPDKGFSWFPRVFNPLTPNGHYSGRTAPLTSRRCILNIYSTNIRSEHFKRTK
jgi:hypothetical protein